MPNIPSSVGQTSAKKRKLSPVSTSSALSPTVSIDISLPSEPLPNGSGDQLSNNQAVIVSNIDDPSAPKTISNENDDQSNNEQIVLDDGILNSEVYQIYCRNEDPKEAMKQIRQLKSCDGFVESTKPFPAEKEFKRACETALDRLWNLKPHLGDSKFDKIKKFADGAISNSELSKSDDTLNIETLFNKNGYFTSIRIVQPKGFEFFYIANFDKGLGLSKWYRGQSSRLYQDCWLARLNVVGVDNSTITKFLYDHYLIKNSRKIEWLDFANEFVRKLNGMLCDNELVVSLVGQRKIY